ncbi:MAG: hypothetical protein CMJ75_16610 [Planctomycetaceae bacterium]|nr:hypothetical protein [Planctomycetaceae bacterium]
MTTSRPRGHTNTKLQVAPIAPSPTADSPNAVDPVDHHAAAKPVENRRARRVYSMPIVQQQNREQWTSFRSLLSILGGSASRK